MMDTVDNKRSEYNRKTYANKLGLTAEQIEARREAARRWKARNKKRRIGGKYVPPDEAERERAREANRRAYAKKTGKPIPPKKTMPEHKWWAELKKKHEGKPRLEKSIVKPIFLTHSHRERYALEVEG